MNDETVSTTTTEENYEEVVLNFLNQFVLLTKEEEQVILENMKPEFFEKGAFLIKEGQIPQSCYFLMKGCVRQFYLKDGEERTTNFFTEGDSIDPIHPTNRSAGSKYYLQCLEDSVLSVGGSNTEEEMFQKFPKFAKICQVATETKLAETNEQLSNFIISSPEERYLNLLDTRPELFNRVPQYQLASFLGMKPESLSRIRKRILKKK